MCAYSYINTRPGQIIPYYALSMFPIIPDTFQLFSQTEHKTRTQQMVTALQHNR